MSPPGNDTVSWRDLAGELSPDHRERLEAIETKPGKLGWEAPFQPPTRAELQDQFLWWTTSRCGPGVPVGGTGVLGDAKSPGGARI
jgi:hypothetical protein